MALTIQTKNNKSIKYDIRIPKREELLQVIDMVNEDNWNMSVEVLYDIYDLQTEGFRAAVDKEGNVLSHCCMLSMDEDNAFVTSFITRVDLRGCGLGKKTWAACKEVVSGKNIVLNAAVNREEMYKNQGFIVSKTRMQFIDYMFPFKRCQSLQDTSTKQSFNVVDYKSSMFDQLYSYDQTIQPIERRAFVRTHINKSDVVKIAFQDDQVVGYICVRKNYKGFAIMPLYANSAQIASQLLFLVVDKLDENTDVKIGIPCGNSKAEGVFRSIGWYPIPYKPINVKLRMHTTRDFSENIDVSKVYSVMNYSYVLI